MNRIRRLTSENTYSEFVGKILNNSADTISNSVIDDVELIKNKLMGYDYEKLELIKMHAASLKEGFARNQLLTVMFGFALGLIPSMLNLFFAATIKDEKITGLDISFLVFIFVVVIILMAIEPYFRKKVVSTALVYGLVDLCIKEAEGGNDKNPRDRWAMFPKELDNMVILERLSEEDPAIAEARKALEKMASDPRAKEIYEQRLKAIIDRNSDLYEAELKGKHEGKMEGETEKAHEVAYMVLLKGGDEQFIAEITGLSPETIQKIKDELLGK